MENGNTSKDNVSSNFLYIIVCSCKIVCNSISKSYYGVLYNTLKSESVVCLRMGLGVHTFWIWDSLIKQHLRVTCNKDWWEVLSASSYYIELQWKVSEVDHYVSSLSARASQTGRLFDLHFT
jgi:hypothetical protein